MRGVSSVGFTDPTPIQKLAIPAALEGKDVIGCAQTGTGKTAAFILPILHRLALAEPIFGKKRLPRALVLTPTRELAQQVQEASISYGGSLSVRTVVLVGGANINTQVSLLQRGTDIVVATPGRLLDLLQRGSIDLSQVQVLVLDEADRMLDMGFIHDVKKIIAKIPRKRQTMLFSATISPEINKLAADILSDPKTVDAGGRQNPVETILQHFYSAPQGGKFDLLIHALEAEKMESVLVFSRTKHGADKICRRLEREGVAAAALHSNRSQPQREKALEGFKQGKYRVLVATDIAARGIDVSGISHVVNFDIPQYPEDYIHRIGRTGRAGASGDAITFVGSEEQQYLRRIEQYTGHRFPVGSYPGFTARPPKPAEAGHSPRQAAPPRSYRNAPDTRHTHGKQPHGTAPEHDRPRHRVSNEVASLQPAAAAHSSTSTTPFRKRPARAKKPTILATRKRKSSKRLDSFSTDRNGGGWSNY